MNPPLLPVRAHMHELVRVLLTHSLTPPPPALLPPLAHCLVRSTIVYSVPSRASGDTPNAKAAAHGVSAGQRPSERDTGSILVWDPASARGGSVRPARNSHGDFVVFAICCGIVKSILHQRNPRCLWLWPMIPLALFNADSFLPISFHTFSFADRHVCVTPYCQKGRKLKLCVAVI